VGVWLESCEQRESIRATWGEEGVMQRALAQQQSFDWFDYQTSALSSLQ
jgi:hypothetical protein